jgi:hypothetical protein
MDVDEELYRCVAMRVQDNLPHVQWLVQEGGANVNAICKSGLTPFVIAATTLSVATSIYGRAPDSATLLWLVEHGGADLTDTEAWDCLGAFSCPGDGIKDDSSPPTVLLRAMLLKAAPPAKFIRRDRLGRTAARLVQEGARLRARLPAYLEQRRVLLDAHCPLPPPLLAIVTEYEGPMTTEELWATGLGLTPDPDVIMSPAVEDNIPHRVDGVCCPCVVQ